MSGICVFISGYVMLKMTEKRMKTQAIAWLQTEQAAKLLYQVGGIIASGAKSGFGLTQKTGKFKMDDMIGQLIGGFIQKKFLGGEQQQSSQPQTEETKMTL